MKFKKEFQVEKNEPILQIKAAKPKEIAETRSTWAGAVSAIIAASKPIELNSIKSITILFSGNIHLDIRCETTKTPAIGLNPRCGRYNCIINSKILLLLNK